MFTQEEILQIINEKFSKKDDLVIMQGNGFLAVYNDYNEFYSRFLENAGLDKQTIEYLANSTKEERDELKRLSMIDYHKKQIEILSKYVK